MEEEKKGGKEKTGKRDGNAETGKIIIQKSLDKYFQQNLEISLMRLPLLNPYAPMHKFCACYRDWY